MSIVYFLVPLALVMAGTFVAFFLLAARGGQFDDLEGPAYRMLIDGDEKTKLEAPAPSKQKAITSDSSTEVSESNKLTDLSATKERTST